MTFPRVWRERDMFAGFPVFSWLRFQSGAWRKECYDNDGKLAAMQTARVRDFVWIWNRGLAFCCWWFVGSCHLTWGHSWVVFDQHPMLQKGSSESEAGHLPWLSCWWLYHCSPASRVLPFPSSYFRCVQEHRPAAAAGLKTVEELWWGELWGGKKITAEQSCSSRTHRESASENGSHAHTKWWSWPKS